MYINYISKKIIFWDAKYLLFSNLNSIKRQNNKLNWIRIKLMLINRRFRINILLRIRSL